MSVQRRFNGGAFPNPRAAREGLGSCSVARSRTPGPLLRFASEYCTANASACSNGTYRASYRGHAGIRIRAFGHRKRLPAFGSSDGPAVRRWAVAHFIGATPLVLRKNHKARKLGSGTWASALPPRAPTSTSASSKWALLYRFRGSRRSRTGGRRHCCAPGQADHQAQIRQTRTKPPIPRKIGCSQFPWRKPPSKKSRQMLLPHNASRSDVRPEQFERRARLDKEDPPGRYLRMLRLSRARRALMSARGRSVTVSKIATRLGFSELGRFSVVEAVYRVALYVRLSCLAIVAISFEDSIKDRSLSSSSGVYKGLRGTILTETAPARPWAAFFFGNELWGFSERPQNA